MLKGNLIKGLGIAATIVGMGATLVSQWVEDKQLEIKIDERVNEVLAKRETVEKDDES